MQSLNSVNKSCRAAGGTAALGSMKTEGKEERSAEPSSATAEILEAEADADGDLKKGAWTTEEDKLLSQLIEVFRVF